MSGFIEGVDRDQVTLFPDRLEDWIDDNHLVRVVDLFGYGHTTTTGRTWASVASHPHRN